MLICWAHVKFPQIKSIYTGKNGGKTEKHKEGGWVWLEPIVGIKMNNKVYNYIMKDCFAYSFANNDGRHSPSLGLDTYWVDACISNYAMIQSWKESFFQLNGSVGIYGTYEISILGRALIDYVTSAITWSGFTVSLLHMYVAIGSYLVSCSYSYIIIIISYMLVWMYA